MSERRGGANPLSTIFEKIVEKMQNVLTLKNMYFVKKNQKYFSISYVLDHSGSFDMHNKNVKIKLFLAVSAKKRFLLYRGGVRTLRTCPQLKQSEMIELSLNYPPLSLPTPCHSS